MTQKNAAQIGRMWLSELPSPYQEVFQAGTAHEQDGIFIPLEEQGCASIINGAISLIYLVPGLMIFIWFPLNVIFRWQDTLAALQRIIQGDWRDWLFLIILIALLVVVGGFMTRAGWRGIRSAYAELNSLRTRQAGQHHYGLLFDDQALVYSRPDFEQPNAFYLPRRMITRIERSTEMVEGAKRRYRRDCVRIGYRYKKRDRVAIISDHRFEISIADLTEALQSWAGLTKPPASSPGA